VALIWALVLFDSYRYAERIFLVFSLAFLAYPVAAVLGHPNWAEVGANLLIPHFIASRDFVLLGVALIGTTVSPYMQLYAAAGVVDRGVAPEDYRTTRLDAITGALFACLANRRSVLGPAANGPLSRIVATIAVIAVAGLSLLLLGQTLLGVLGLG
jgi:Mn2+/Fe2+ NRAMP family transporter